MSYDTETGEAADITDIANTARWFPDRDDETWVPGSAEPLRLYCLSHSGASRDLFTPWIGQLPGVVVRPMERPGRGTRLAEASITDMATLVDAAIAALRADTAGRPFALLGHSLGALTAFEMVRAMQAHLGNHSGNGCGDRAGDGGAGPLPEHLVVSGHPAPDAMQDRISMQGKSRAEVLAFLTRLGGTSAGVRPKLLDRFVLPAFLADSEIGDTYHYQPGPPVPVPITALSADADPQAPVFTMVAWRAHTSAGFDFQTLHGDHFAIRHQTPAVLAILANALAIGQCPPIRRPA